MGAKFHSLIDVTIVYPDSAPMFWQFVCGNTGRVVVRARQLPIPRELCAGDYGADAAFRRRFNHWIARLWEEKDRQIDALLQGSTRLQAA